LGVVHAAPAGEPRAERGQRQPAYRIAPAACNRARRAKHEGPAAQLAVRDRERGARPHPAAPQRNIEIKRARPKLQPLVLDIVR